MDSSTIEHRIDAEGADYLTLAGVNDSHLQELAKLSNCRVILRGDHLILSGELSDVERAVPVAERLVNLARTGQSFDIDDVRRAAGAHRLDVLGRVREVVRNALRVGGAQNNGAPESMQPTPSRLHDASGMSCQMSS